MNTLHPYRGYTRKLVLAFDVGTTYSGISYALLDPGEVPTIRGVTRFPGQENVAGDSKIPSILYYTTSGQVYAVGAEAALLRMADEVTTRGLIFVEWFKLHLRPTTLHSEPDIRARTPPLPSGKTIIDVFADFLRYLYACARRYIVQTHANGENLWNSFGSQIEFILSHPNGWEGSQQTKMRRAAVQGGLVPDDSAGHARIHFVTEGEASMNYCLNCGLAADSVKEGNCVMIVDAGGGTIDLSTYKFTKMVPVTIEEAVTPDCIMQGSTTVNVRAEAYLKNKLRDSVYKADIKTMLEYFDKSTKPLFKARNDACYIKFGSLGCNDNAVQIRRGQMILSGENIASFFEPAISAIVNAVIRQRDDAPSLLTEVFLVGGFAASPWLFSQLHNTLRQAGLHLSRPNKQTSKAVPEGAVAHYLERRVSARTARLTFGVPCSVDYNASDPEHYRRRNTVFKYPSGRLLLPGHFDVILAKGTQFREHEEVSQPYCREERNNAELNRIWTTITCYRGKSGRPQWKDVEIDSFSTLCTVHADTSQVCRVQKWGTMGPYYEQEYKVVLICGLTELQAQISWKENGVEKRGPATIVYDDEAQAIN